MIVFTDSASLMWRLSLAGKTGLEPYWQEVAAYGDRFFPQAGPHFADVHYALVAAATGSGELATRLAQMEARDADGKLAPGSSAIELCRGIRAFAEGDNENAIRILKPLMPAIVRIGGSHAQRELWEDTLIVACLRAGHRDKAMKMISDRLRPRPSAPDKPWSPGAQPGAQKPPALGRTIELIGEAGPGEVAARERLLGGPAWRHRIERGEA